jgi:hypothetical protein
VLRHSVITFFDFEHPHPQLPQVSLEKYLSSPDMHISEVPSQSDLAAPTPRPSSVDGTDRGYGSSTRSTSASRSSGGKSGMGPGEIAGLVIGLLAGLGILGALAYFVGYKKFYQAHKATSFKRSDIPEGPSEYRLCCMYCCILLHVLLHVLLHTLLHTVLHTLLHVLLHVLLVYSL